MPRPALTWITTDTHFFHDRMVELCGRPVDFNERIMKNLRHYVAEQDTLIHLGDVIFYNLQRLKPMLESVPCRAKILVMGNHDKESRGWYERHGFDFACDSFTLGDIMFSHKPQPELPSWIRLNCHGHLHCLSDRIGEFSSFYNEERYKLLALEYTSYKPVNLESFAARKNS